MATVTSIAGGAPKPVFDRLGLKFEQRIWRGRHGCELGAGARGGVH